MDLTLGRTREGWAGGGRFEKTIYVKGLKLSVAVHSSIIFDVANFVNFFDISL